MQKTQKGSPKNWAEQRARLSAISQAIDIPDFAENVLHLERIQPPTGGWLRASCPFSENHQHGDVKRSFALSMDGTGRYNCFVCGRGDLANLLMRLWKKTFDDVLDYLMDYVSLDVSKIASMWANPVVHEKRPFLYEDARLAAVQKRVSMYVIHERHVSLRTYKLFRLGYHKRIVYFPLYDFKEKLIGLFTRPIDEKQYLFEPGTPRSEWLYGLERSKEGELCFLVESPFDCLRLVSMGYNSVASMGSSFSHRQAELAIDRFTAVCYLKHNDKAGTTGRIQAYEAIDNRIPFFSTKIWKHRKDIGEMTDKEIRILMKTQFLFLHQTRRQNAFVKTFQ